MGTAQLSNPARDSRRVLLEEQFVKSVSQLCIGVIYILSLAVLRAMCQALLTRASSHFSTPGARGLDSFQMPALTGEGIRGVLVCFHLKASLTASYREEPEQP